MLAIRRKCALRPDVGTSAAKPLHSAAKRMHVSACFWALFDSNIALLLKGGSACLSQSSAGQKTVPMIALTWERVGYIARGIFPIFEHVHGIAGRFPDHRRSPLMAPTPVRIGFAGHWRAPWSPAAPWPSTVN